MLAPGAPPCLKVADMVVLPKALKLSCEASVVVLGGVGAPLNADGDDQTQTPPGWPCLGIQAALAHVRKAFPKGRLQLVRFSCCYQCSVWRYQPGQCQGRTYLGFLDAEMMFSTCYTALPPSCLMSLYVILWCLLVDA